MGITKKDLIGLADALRPAYAAGRLAIKDAEAVADYLQSSNPAFKRERWLGYLRGTNGPGGGEVAQ